MSCSRVWLSAWSPCTISIMEWINAMCYSWEQPLWYALPRVASDSFHVWQLFLWVSHSWQTSMTTDRRKLGTQLTWSKGVWIARVITKKVGKFTRSNSRTIGYSICCCCCIIDEPPAFCSCFLALLICNRNHYYDLRIALQFSTIMASYCTHFWHLCQEIYNL